MRLESIAPVGAECDGCGIHAPESAPRGWFDRPLDPPHYTGPRRLRFCPRCYAALPASQQRRWRGLDGPRSAPRMVTVARRLFHFPSQQAGLRRVDSAGGRESLASVSGAYAASRSCLKAQPVRSRPHRAIR